MIYFDKKSKHVDFSHMHYVCILMIFNLFDATNHTLTLNLVLMHQCIFLLLFLLRIRHLEL